MTAEVLSQQLAIARRRVVSDGYEMSVGEVLSLYRDGELVISPEFQRLFRWDESQKTRFIESLLLGIPIPPIFVFQQESGVWELVDGLQRVSTLLQFTGALTSVGGREVGPLELEGTSLVPGLADMRWEARDSDDKLCFDVSQQLTIKRARIRVEILKKESDPDAKYELFQRLNTGGSPLSEQEVRNCVLVMVNRPFYTWLVAQTARASFVNTVSLTEAAQSQQKHIELALRFVAFRHVPYSPGLDVNEYLDAAALQLTRKDDAFRTTESSIFERTFDLLSGALGDNAFRKWDGVRHTGPFLISGFEAIAHGVASNIDAIESMEPTDRITWLIERVRSLWSETLFVRNSGMGVRGTTRLTYLLPFGPEFFRP
jgi:hypothetical protein